MFGPLPSTVSVISEGYRRSPPVTGTESKSVRPGVRSQGRIAVRIGALFDVFQTIDEVTAEIQGYADAGFASVWGSRWRSG